MNNQSKRVCVEVAVNAIKVTMYGWDSNLFQQ